MEEGMLWFDNTPHSKRQVNKKVARAAAHYRKTRGEVPNVCHVRPSTFEDLDGDPPATVGPVCLILDDTILKHHYWIGIDPQIGGDVGSSSASGE